MGMSRPHARLTNTGFTLVELLVVVAIIALLIAILLPSLAAARETARRSVCAGQMRSIFTALLAYEADHRAFPPGLDNMGCVMAGRSHVAMRDGYGLVRPITICPSAGPYTNNSFAWENNGTEGKLTYMHFAGQGDSTLTGNLNGWTASTLYLRLDGFYPPVKLLEVRRPSAFPYSMEIAYKFTATIANWKPARANHPEGATTEADGQNVSYFDGHVTWDKFRLGESMKYHRRSGTDIAWWTPTISIGTPSYLP